jgi:hypothetical protein
MVTPMEIANFKKIHNYLLNCLPLSSIVQNLFSAENLIIFNIHFAAP